ncbi:MAG TPA: PRC-barrel domain-containing protein [Jatrophihabitans sp.]|jgi:sporulation protein YlmC with PRC-barrel domain|nr:PRC-barrel domain-containing protein [Jatrophihabitans sp.]
MSGTGFTADIVGRAVFDPGGERIGQLVDLYADTETGAVSFAGVAMIRRGRRRLVFVSLTDASIEPASVTVKCGKELARRAPYVRPGQTLPADTEPALFAHYDIPYQSPQTQERRLTPCR